MSQFDEVLSHVPVSQLASQFGVDESQITEAAKSALPALFGGLQANATDPAGAESILDALNQHQGEVPSDVNQVDVNDGQKIVGHIFGDNTDQVVHRLGDASGGDATGDLVKKLLPILAPIVLSWLANKMSQQGGLGGVLGGMLGGGADTAAQPTQTQQGGGSLFPGGQGAQSGPVQAPAGPGAEAPPAEQSGGMLQDILGSVLGGGSGQKSGGAGDILGGILGGLLGGGRR